ncbi:MAG: (Fe-S)-binding protein, partial [Cyanobacteriota bacterium]
MSLSGIQIFKLLPGGKKAPEANCKKCNFPTCMAYAMKLAKGEALIEQCCYISDELKDLIESQSGKKQETITFGINQKQIKTGGETVLYRHDKTFLNPTCISIKLTTSKGFEYFNNTIQQIKNYKVERIGEEISIQCISIQNDNNDSDMFIKFISKLVQENLDACFSLILVSFELDDLIKGYNLLVDSQKPILFLKNANKGDYTRLYQSTCSTICIEADTIDDLATLSEKLEAEKVKDLILAIPDNCKDNIIETLTLIRRSVVINNIKALRFPILTDASEYILTQNDIQQGIWAGCLLSKYSNIVLINFFNPAIVYSLFTLRQNLFTDPQKPLQIEPNLY